MIYHYDPITYKITYPNPRTRPVPNEFYNMVLDEVYNFQPESVAYYPQLDALCILCNTKHNAYNIFFDETRIKITRSSRYSKEHSITSITYHEYTTIVDILK